MLSSYAENEKGCVWELMSCTNRGILSMLQYRKSKHACIHLYNFVFKSDREREGRRGEVWGGRGSLKPRLSVPNWRKLDDFACDMVAQWYHKSWKKNGTTTTECLSSLLLVCELENRKIKMTCHPEGHRATKAPRWCHGTTILYVKYPRLSFWVLSKAVK